jgi:tetratricopeptide (TPR) repeat protein
MQARGWIAFFLTVSTFAVFYQVHDFQFVHYDDYIYVVQNANLRDGLGVRSFLNAFGSNFQNWIPLTVLSLHLDFELFGLNAGGYHLINVAMHIISALLLFFALSRMTGMLWQSGFVAAIFAIHPLHVESVAWVTERKDTLSGVFWMLTLCAYARYCEKPESSRRYALTLTCLALGLMAKPTIVALPFVLLLLDYWPLRRLCDLEAGARPKIARVRRLVVEKIPMLAVVAVVSLTTLLVQHGAMADAGTVPLRLRIANAIQSCAIYMWKTLWPSELAVFYPHPLEQIATWSVVASGLLLAGISVAAFRLAGTRPYLIVGWLWFIGTLIPVIGLVQVGMQARADRYMYLPIIGLAIFATWGVSDLAERWRLPRRALAAAAVAVLATLGALAWVQTGTWRNTESLFTHALAVTDGNYVIHREYGKALLQEGRIDEAEQNFKEALQFKPDWAPPRIGLIDVTMARGHTEEAIRGFKAELALDPDHVGLSGRYGLALGLLGRYGEARAFLVPSLVENPGNADLHRGMAEIEAALGNPEASVRHGWEALRLSPDYTDAANNLAWTLATCYDPAIRNPAEAIALIETEALQSGDPFLLDSLAAAYAAAGNFDRAISTASRAVSEADRLGQALNARDIRARLALYRSDRPFIEPTPR